MWLIVLIEITVIVRDFLQDGQLICTDVLLQDSRGCVTGNFDDIINIHPRQIHQSRACAPGCVRRDKFPFLLGSLHLLAVLHSI